MRRRRGRRSPRGAAHRLVWPLTARPPSREAAGGLALPASAAGCSSVKDRVMRKQLAALVDLDRHLDLDLVPDVEDVLDVLTRATDEPADPGRWSRPSLPGSAKRGAEGRGLDHGAHESAHRSRSICGLAMALTASRAASAEGPSRRRRCRPVPSSSTVRSRRCPPGSG